jgi:SpoVK/Ycf46/Vps4 family AAA+-type ATPase
MSFEAEVREKYGEIEKPERMLAQFKTEAPVADEDIVLEDEVREVLWRNVIDLQNRREVLKAHGVPVRRGVLFYGPPGTGKTFACRYLYGKLRETTIVVVTGTALLHVRSVFNFARMLQPSLFIFEDVDLVFQSRDANVYSPVLGDLLDQMDGLRPDEDIGFILTTNAIERLEAAIKDRPGRISQCIHFDVPTPDLRRRYLRRYLRDYKAAAVDVDHLLRLSDGATQAFLKEWVFRAVQFAVERLNESNEDLVLQTDDFDRSMEEMRKYTEKSTAKIIGFGSKA